MRRSSCCLLVTVIGLVVGCTKLNPAFDDLVVDGGGGDGDGDGDGDPGDGDPGDGDGDPGDGDPGDGDPGCMPPLSDCFGMCVDTHYDPNNCGSCGVECVGSCDGGSCSTQPERIVFVSSEFRTGMMGGLEGADAFCTELAANAGLQGEFKAWLSTQVLGPNERMTHFQLPYRLTTGQVVANSWTDLTDGSLAHPIDKTEEGDIISNVGVCDGNEVWTNTRPDGTPNTTDDCGDWTHEQGTSNVGQFTSSDMNWSDHNCEQVTCATPLPVYCVQQ